MGTFTEGLAPQRGRSRGRSFAVDLALQEWPAADADALRAALADGSVSAERISSASESVDGRTLSVGAVRNWRERYL